MDRILLAVDLTEASRPILRRGLELSRAFCARMGVVHVLPTLVYTPEFSSLGALLGSSRAESELELDDLVSGELKGLPDAGLVVDQSVREGSVVDEVLQEARDWNASLVVVGCHSGPPAQRLFLGSVATGVLSHAPVPVLLVRERERAEADGSVLVAIDGRKPLEPVLCTAAEWAARLSRKLTVLHVFEALPEGGRVKMSSSLELESKLRQLRAELEAQVEANVREVFSGRPMPAIRHRIGRPYTEVSLEAAEGGHELVIVDWQAWGGKAQIGNHAVRVAHGCPCSVLVLRH